MNISKSINDIRKTTSQSNGNASRNPWALAIAGIMVTFVTVNMIFILVAFVTSPGLVVENYYEAGRAYEKNALKMLAATQNTKNWETKLDMENQIFVGHNNIIRFAAVDERGLPVKDVNVSLIAYRPSDADQDVTVPMLEIAPGLFEASVIFSLKGIWDVNVKLVQGDSKFELQKRISVKL